VCKCHPIDIDTHRVEVIGLWVSSSPIIHLSDIDILGCLSYIDIYRIESHLFLHLTQESISPVLSPIESATREIIHTSLFLVVL
jgi:hypothetical protein